MNTTLTEYKATARRLRRELEPLTVPQLIELHCRLARIHRRRIVAATLAGERDEAHAQAITHYTWAFDLARAVGLQPNLLNTAAAAVRRRMKTRRAA